MLFPSPHTMHMHYITPMLYIFQIVGRCHTARPALVPKRANAFG